jgi:thioredoxin reductase
MRENVFEGLSFIKAEKTFYLGFTMDAPAPIFRKKFVVKNVENGTTETLPCDGIFISIGRAPATEFLRGVLPLDKAGYIIADETTKTPISGVFAAGDLRTKPLRQIVTATADGATAAHFAAEYLELI